MQQDFLPLEGADLYYEVTGEGVPLVFVHGLSIDNRMWNPQIDFFSKYYQVIRYDVRGFGKSVFKGEPQSQIAADDLKALLDHLHIKKAHIVGLSMGGNIALSFAATYPEYVLRLVAADADVQGFDNYTEEFKAMFTEVFRVGAESGGLKAKLTWAQSPLLQPVVSNEHTALIEVMIRDFSGLHLTNPKFLPSGHSPTAQILHQITAPTLVIIGEKDIEDFQRMANYIVKHVPQVYKKVISGAGHLPNMEQATMFNEAVHEFLKSLVLPF